ncbi:MAG: hypothetical protein GXY41_03565 [Phycisphaerae bacterium]|nr:hypothetical protein [Phycisphaerae bacterium]
MTQSTTDNGPALTAAYLEELLGRQIERLKTYDLDAAVAMAEESEPVAAELMRTEYLKQPENSETKARIRSLYRELTLIIASQRQDVSDKLDQIRDGLKTLGTYAGKLR